MVRKIIESALLDNHGPSFHKILPYYVAWQSSQDVVEVQQKYFGRLELIARDFYIWVLERGYGDSIAA